VELDDPVESLAAPGPTPDPKAMCGEARGRKSAAMGHLIVYERTAFVLRHFEGMCIEEVSRVLGCQPAAARHSVFRAVKKLRRALEPLVGTAR
jgi:RNA polymerase sigma-70 factor (ECF subfamily)